MITIRRSEERGHTKLSWLQSHHTFSFGGYYDPEHMGISVLRVINDDKVIPSAGFATHSHQDMEIISYVKKGVIEHQDSMGNIKSLPSGEFQLMSAGSGVTHSEYNPSKTEDLDFLQIWIQPNQLGIEPGYQQKPFEYQQGFTLIASPEAANGALRIHQDASMYRLILEANQTASHTLHKERTVYVHMVSGELNVNGETLSEGDGACINKVTALTFTGVNGTEALVFDLP